MSDQAINLNQSAEKVVLSTVYALLLIFLYRDSVYPNFGYMGFPFYGINWILVSFQLALISLIAALLPSEFNKISDLCSWLMFKMVFIPTLVIAGIVVEHISLIQLIMTNGLLVLCILSTISVSKIEMRASFPTLSPSLFWIITGAISLFFIVFVVMDYGFSFSRLLDLRNYSEIYDIRYAYRDQKNAASFISNYGLLWLAKVIVPLFWGWGLYKKSKIIIVLSLITQIGLFAISAHKSFLFGLVFIYFVYWISIRPHSGMWFLRAIVGFTVFSSILFYLVEIDIFVSIIVRRVFIVPGMLSGFFLEFYSNNPLALYANNFLSDVFNTVYNTSPAFTVGKAYFGRVETSANVNFWGDAFGNMGYLGLIIITLLLNIILIMINALSNGKNKISCLSLFAVSFWTITETSLTTTLVSHGLGLALLLVFLLNKEKDNTLNNSKIKAP